MGQVGRHVGRTGEQAQEETEEVKLQIDMAVGDLNTRMDKTEKRMDGLAEEVISIVDRRMATNLSGSDPSAGPAMPKPPDLAVGLALGPGPSPPLK